MTTQTRTNTKAQLCERCGTLVPAGGGRLEYISQDWLDDNDDFINKPGWKVTHLNRAVCDAKLAEQRAKEQAAEVAAAERREARKTVLQYMLSSGRWVDAEPDRVEYFISLVVERGVWVSQKYNAITREEVLARLAQGEEFSYGTDWFESIRYAR